ncbi:MAG: SulP family inorganic anion transporter [Fimbriimonas sp.]
MSVKSENLKKDFLSSIVVFLVAVPLSLGIALASGAPIISGIIAGVIGGIVVGLLGGAPLQVSGPAAGLTVLVFGVVQQFGWPTACLITALAGLIQLGLGASKVARAALAISPAVVHGMLAGIGVTIAIAQFQVMLGGKTGSSAIANLKALPGHLTGLNAAALVLGVISIAILVLWPKLPKKAQVVPAPLVAVVIPTIVSVVAAMSVKRIELPSDLLGGIRLPAMPSSELLGPVFISALTIALVASVESLLSAVATDKMHRGPRANLDKELIGQGAANTLSGLLGGLPVTGVIVRSSANIASGATSRLSTILHGVWILLFVALFGGLLQSVPLAALAGLLVHVGAKLVKIKDIQELAKHRELPAYFATMLGVVFIDLIAGVAIGLAISFFMVFRRMAMTEVKVDYGQGTTRVQVFGTLTFMNVPRLMKTLNTIPAGERVEMEIHADFMDHAAFEALHSWEKGHLESGGQLMIDETNEEWYEPAKAHQPKVHKSPLERREPALSAIGGGK